eukprot:jgi/Undpi1/5380/HiC_scaffold_2.g00661.m1
MKRKRSAALPAAAAAAGVRPSLKRVKAGKENGFRERVRPFLAREKAEGLRRETAKVAVKGGNRAKGLNRETPQLAIKGASSAKGLIYATPKLAIRGASPAKRLNRETPKGTNKGASSAKGLKRDTLNLAVKDSSRAKGLNRGTSKVAIKGVSNAREKEHQRKRSGVRRREEPRATPRQRTPENSRKAAKPVLSVRQSKRKTGQAVRVAPTKSKQSRPRQELFKFPTSRDRRAFKLSKANRYADNSLRGLVSIDEIPLCHCDVEIGCDANCINRQLLMECAPGRCPTLRGGAKHCLNNAIQTRSFPSTEIFRTAEGRGWGLRLSDEKGADAGTLLHEYLGQVIGMDECRKRLRKVGRKGVEGSSSDFYFASLDGNLVLDAGPMGSEARFANHSCAPNCILQKWSVLGETRVVLVAAKDIAYAEELTYNYQADTLEGFVERQRCLCGEPQCSGFIGGELVAVKADEWRRRSLKVMGQAKPQLALVRELFNEGRDLDFQEEGEDGGVCYRGREMQCLSTMLKEGDAWLAELAEVLEGTPDKPSTDPSPPPNSQRLRSAVAAGDACCVDGVGGRPGGGACDEHGDGGRRGRSRGNSVVEVNERRRAGREVSASFGSGNMRSSKRGVDDGNGKRREIKRESGVPNGTGNSPPAAPGDSSAATLDAAASLERGKRGTGSCVSGRKNGIGENGDRCFLRREGARSASDEGEGELKVPCAVDLSRLEQVLEKAPPGLQMAEAAKARKTATRAGHVARTVWAILDAASKHGLDVLVPEQPAALLLHPVKPAAARRSTMPSSGQDEGKGRASERGSKGPEGATAIGAAARTRRKGGAGGGREEVTGVGCGDFGRNGERRSGGANDKGMKSGGDGMDVCDEEGVTKPQLDGDSADARSRGARSEPRSEPSDEAAHAAGVSIARSVNRGDSSMDDSESSSTENGANTRAAPCPEVAAVPVTTRSRGKRHMPPLVVQEEPLIAPPPPLVAGEGGESPALPPKPKMSQVYQAIRSCRGLAPVSIPGSSELEKLVASAEAWASKACEILKIKIEVNTTSDSDAAVKDKKDTDVTKDATEKDNKDGSKEKEKSRWEKLGLESSAMSALEEKLQEVAEFSLAREQREEELEKERVLKEKEDTKEREKQAKLDKLARYKCLAKRRRPRGGGGGGVLGGGASGVEGGNAAGNDGEGGVGDAAWEARRSPRCISSVNGDDPNPSTAKPGVVEAGMGMETSDACASGSGMPADPYTTEEDKTNGWKPEDEDALHCLCRLPADTARFRTLMTCDLCHSWFHPACVRLKEVRASQRNNQALAFACPMCEHKRGGVSSFACPPSPGFYIGRRMHRPGLAELEPLVAHAERLPVDGVDGQDYLSYMVKQVVDWSGRCHAAVKDVQEYIQRGSGAGLQTCTPGVAEHKFGGEAAEHVEMQNSSPLSPAGGLASNSTPGDGHLKAGGDRAFGSEQSMTETRKEALVRPKEASDVSSSVPPAAAESATPACRGDGDALSGIDARPVVLKQDPAVEGGSGALATIPGAGAPAAPGVGQSQECAQQAIAQGCIEGANVAGVDIIRVASRVDATPVVADPSRVASEVDAVAGLAESCGCVQPVVAQGEAEGANPAEESPANVSSQMRGTPVQASPGLASFQVGATPVEPEERAEKEGGADAAVGVGITGDSGCGVKGGGAGSVGGGGGVGEALIHQVELSSLKSPVGLVLPSVGRDLVFEAGLMERLGRLVCEGALIEVVDVHKEDVMIRRALWMLAASLAYPTAAASLRAGQQPGLEETLSVRDQELLRSSGLSSEYPTRLRPTFETLEASLTEGRTLGLSRNKGKDKCKSRRGSGSHSGAGFPEPPLPPPGGLTGQGLVDMRPSSEPLGAGARVYGCLFDAVGDIIQAVVKAEAKPFREARMFLPVLKTATRWAAIEPSWGFARALASELCWLRESGTGDGAAGKAWEPEEGTYCICRGGDYGGVMVSCDACSEWFHASCVGLTARVADGLQEYYCLVCCGSQPEKYGHYAHSWVTNVAVEAAVRRIAPKKAHPISSTTKKRKNKAISAARTSGGPENSPLHVGKGSRLDIEEVSSLPLNSGAEGEDTGTGCISTGAGSNGVPVTPGRGTRKRQRVASARLAEAVADAAEMVSSTSVVPTKRVRDKKSRAIDPPGAKRARATAWVASYVKRHYAELGVRWPPERPSWREEVREDLDGHLEVSPDLSGYRNIGDGGFYGASQEGYAISARPSYLAGAVGASHGGYAIPSRSPSLAELLAAGQAAEKEGAGDQSSLQAGVAGEGFVGPCPTFGTGRECSEGQPRIPLGAGGVCPNSDVMEENGVGFASCLSPPSVVTTSLGKQDME